MIFSPGSAIVIIGVSGTGKTTLGRRLAATLQVPYLEGDDFHPPANIEKMSRGIPLGDDDRWPWLDALATAIVATRTAAGIVATCSALRRRYRQRLKGAIAPPVAFVCLATERAILAARLEKRAHHFMPASLLDSQLAAFEMPDPDEHACILDAGRPVEELVAQVVRGNSMDSTTRPPQPAQSSSRSKPAS